MGLSGATGLAHHSFSAVYDSKRSVTITGVVTEFRFANPHAMLSLDVTDDAGKAATWGVEFAGRLNLAEIGWTAQSLKPGDRVTVTGNPTHVVSRQIAFVRIVKADGTVLVPAAAQRADALEQERRERARRRTQPQ
jgi:DNA/RNA endonuclease YhcR with UshA esterase domain